MKLFAILTLMIIGLYSCSTNKRDELKNAIKEKENSIGSSTNQMLGQSNNSAQLELIALLDSFSKTYPEDVFAPECLDKIHMVYSALGEYRKSAMYADTILEKYPDYINRPLILESQASAFDFYIVPRDTVKVRHYYNLLLKEDISDEKRDEIRDRLDNISLTFEELILKNN